MEKLLLLLKNVRPDVDFEKEYNLIDDGVLDSVDILSIVVGLKNEFGIELSMTDLDPEDFNSLDSMWSLIRRLKNSVM